jgi:glycerol-3-phosphate dehydrogenase
MLRDLQKLADRTFDLLVIGGGIHGAAMFWEACRAGLNAAVIEQGDFGQATSANTQKIMHGGLRYLQQLDLPRVRQSATERLRLLYLAPHLVQPLPCVMPLYGHGMKGKEAAWLGLRLYDAVSLTQNGLRGMVKDDPRAQILSKSKVNNIIPCLEQGRLRGGLKWYDAICSNTERLVLAFIKSGCKLGGTAANYITATGLERRTDSPVIVGCYDNLFDNRIHISAKKVINCTGPWIPEFLKTSNINMNKRNQALAMGINIVTKRVIPSNVAFAARDQAHANSRVYFVVPWRHMAIVGTEWWAYDGRVDDLKVRRNHCQKLLDGFNSAFPSAGLKLGDIRHVHTGLVPSYGKGGLMRDDAFLMNRYQIMDHSKDGMNGVFSVMGVKYTTAVDVARRVLRQVMPGGEFRGLSSRPRLIGGEIDDLEEYETKVLNDYGQKVEQDNLLNLIANYGSELDKVMEYAQDTESEGPPKPLVTLDIIRGMTLFAVRHEMAQKLSDVILRRTDRGSAGPPRKTDLEKFSQCMKKELGWTESRRVAEIEELRGSYPDFLPFLS